MDTEILDRLNKHWARNFYTEPLVSLCFLSCTIIAILYNNKEKERLFF